MTQYHTFHRRDRQSNRNAARAIAFAAAALGSGVAVSASAQSSSSSMARMHIVSTSNACRQISAVPTTLVQTPEGIAILKMQAEVSSTLAAMAARGERERDLVETRQLMDMRIRLDSLGREVMRVSPLPSNRPVRIFIDSGDGSRRRIEATIRQLGPEVTTAAGRVRSAAPSFRQASPSGWVGVRSSNSFVTRFGENGALLMGYCEYPVVESVDADSPAQKAGVLAGDTIIAYNGKDLLENDFDNMQTLVAGKLLRMKVRRGGKVREISMTLAPRPTDVPFVVSARTTCGNNANCEAVTGSYSSFTRDSTSSFSFVIRTRDSAQVAPQGAPRVGNMTGGGGAGGGGAVIRAAQPSMTPAPVAGTVTGGRMVPSTGGFMFSYGDPIAGATLMTIDEDMAAAMGVDSAGVVIMRVYPNTPAFNLGLKGGEYIREVNGTPVRDLISLRRAMAAEKIRITVTSKNSGARTVVLR